MNLRIHAAGITHRGTVRDNNEDCIAIGFWVSQETMVAARPFEHALDEPFACIVADGMGGHNDGEKASLLVARSLARRLIAAGLVIFNVGDSRAYKLGERGLMQLSTDDSMLQNWKAGSGVERSTKLLQSFGGRTTFTDIEPHLLLEPCIPGSTYLLCSDGLY